MDKILEFRNLLVEDELNREININREPGDSRLETTYTFSLAYKANYHVVINNQQIALITLDEEDIAYFKDKYFPKLINEMEAKIKAVKVEYEGK